MAVDSEKDGKKREEGEAKASGGSMRKMLPVLLAGVGIVLVAGAAWFGFRSMAPGEASAQSEVSVKNLVPVVYELEPFTCNLRPNEFGEMWLYNTTLSLHLDTAAGEQEKLLTEEVKNRKDQIRAIISNTISHRTKEMLRSPEGREALRREIIRDINSVLVNGQIKDVFFQKALYTMA